MRGFEEVTVTRDVPAVQIPFGDRIVIASGSQVTITQALGGTYTVSTDYGYLARIDGSDADALGKEPMESTPEQVPAQAQTTAEELEARVWEELRTVFDPEIPASVVDLGLVYGVKCEHAPSGRWKVEVTMTLTAPGCGMGDILKADAESRVMALPGVEDSVVEMVTEPPWNPSMMTEAARLELGIF